MQIYIINEGLNIIAAFLELPHLLVATGLVMQYAVNNIAIDGFATVGAVL